MTIRRLLRRVLPAELRLFVTLTKRRLRDAVTRTSFAESRGEPRPHRFAEYRLEIRTYPGQEAQAANKRVNQHVMARALDGVEIAPGEVFSLWRWAGRPTRRRGYREAAALVDGKLTTEIGGATCLVATVIYNTALLGGMELLERANHSVDSYGDDRYFEIGRDAIIEYGYRDLQFRNTGANTVVLHVRADDRRVSAWLTADRPPVGTVEVEATPIQEGADGRHGVRVTRRRTEALHQGTSEDLGWSWYADPDGSVA